MAKKKLNTQDMAARKVAHACSIIEDLLLKLYGNTYPERAQLARASGKLAEELVDVTGLLDGIQLCLETGGYILPSKKKSKAASAGK
jgi:hypothetical protein